jgi:predicted transcriptional regulator
MTETDRYTDAELDQLRRLLRSVNRPVSNNEIASLMGVTKGEASKRVSLALASGIVSRRRVGREVAISLH